MGNVRGFWVGASRWVTPEELVLFAEAAGGWARLEEGGRDGLVELGLSPERARAWTEAPDLPTRGEALTPADPGYPRALLRLPAPPPFLCVEGDPGVLTADLLVGVVGTRRCTGYGMGVARHLGADLARAGAVVVSGLARGIDGHAHRATLGVGRTVAVLGHGLGHTSPATHRSLRADILREGGAVVSTWPDDQRPSRYTFPIRNAWIAGLSEALVVVEAPLRSGAMITARLAADLGLEVHAVPGPVGSEASRGCLELLDAGASVVRSVGELVEHLAGRRVQRSDWLEDVFAGVPLDVTARAQGVSILELLGRLALLEAQGEVVRLPGRRYAPAGGDA